MKTDPATLLPRIEAAPDLAGTIVGTSDAPATVVMLFATWCSHCKDELVVIDSVRAKHPTVRLLGVNYKAFEEYGKRGGAPAVKAFVAATPWLRVVPAGDDLYAALGKPKKTPAMFVFDHAGMLVETYERETRAMPTAAELDALFTRLGG